MTHVRVSARAGSAWRPRRCGAASPRSTRAVACWAARPRTGSGRGRRSWGGRAICTRRSDPTGPARSRACLPVPWSRPGGVRESGRRLGADDRWGLVDEFVILEGRHHEERKVHAACDVALEDGVAHVPAPHRQALALALLEVAPAHDGPSRVACKHPPARLDLIIEVDDASEARDPADDIH